MCTTKASSSKGHGMYVSTLSIPHILPDLLSLTKQIHIKYQESRKAEVINQRKMNPGHGGAKAKALAFP